MLLLDRIKNSQNLSDSETKIAQYILKNPKTVIDMTIHELSDNTFASAATITRFCRKVKLDGFSELKLQLAKELNTFSMTKNRIEDNIPFTKIDTHEDIARNIMNLNIQAMLDTYNLVDINQLVKIATWINNAPQVNLYGRGQSLILCEDFQYKLLRIGYDANTVNQEGFQLMRSQSQSKDAIAIVISYYGQGENNFKIVKALKEKNIKVILLTGPKVNRLCPFAHEIVHVPAQEELFEKMASYSSRAALQLVIDIIYALVFSFNYDRNQKHVKET